MFVSNLRDIDAILGTVCRRRGLAGDDADDFCSWAKFRLIENDYAVLAKFRQKSSLRTYLSVVLSRQFEEYRVKEWGRWRPSALAKAQGALAVQLERLTTRDGLTLAQAAEFLRTTGATKLSDSELAAIARDFPMRTPQRPVQSISAPPDAAAPDHADELVEKAELNAQIKLAMQALDAAMSALSPQDRLLLRLVHLETRSIAEVARGLQLPSKPMYRQLKRAEKTLRLCLERAGITLDVIRNLPFGYSEGPM